MSYNCLRGAYEKLKLVLCISKAPLWHPWGSAKALLTRTQTKQSFVLPHLFSSPVSIFLIRVFHFFTHVCRSSGPPSYLRSCFWVRVSSLCLSVITLLTVFCFMRGTQRITAHIVTLVWILSDTMNTTFRRTRRRTYIMMKLNQSSMRRRIRGALEMT